MKNTFKEYNQFTKDEFQKLWQECIFVFDTNALLNMYRYSRGTFESFINVLKELKSQKRIWIPYQVGYEFHENRINVINEHEASYDEILEIIRTAKNSIKQRYKDHPFLDLEKIQDELEDGLAGVEKIIETGKKKHPKWMYKDDVLEKLNQIFDNSVGKNYDTEKLIQIKKEGEERYNKSIPPGFKDKSKPDEKRYGDLILWFQIIDKASEIKKPVVFVSGDVKEDWWLIKEGKRISPHPHLKKEIMDKAKVDFHIYTSDKFLHHAKDYIKDTNVDEKMIDEVKKISEEWELKEKLNKLNWMKIHDVGFDKKMEVIVNQDMISLLNRLHEILIFLNNADISQKYFKEIEHFDILFKELRNRCYHEKIDYNFIFILNNYLKNIGSILNKAFEEDKLNINIQNLIREYQKISAMIADTVRRNM